jgi:Type II secretion system (T2SS), protein F
MMDTRMAIAGAVMGTGLTVTAAGLWPTVPDLKAAVARLDRISSATLAQGETTAAGRWATTAVLLAHRVGLDRYRSDLDLVGDGPAQLMTRKIGYALLGLVFPPVLVTVMGLLGLWLPLPIPVLGSLLLATGLFFVPDLDLRRRAQAARDQMRRAVCVYLELVALERAADAGAVEALERAAAIGDGRAFELIGDALLRARLFGVAPWRELGRLADQLRVPELGDVADIMRLSGEDGAAVYATLRARAASLRTAVLNADTAAANTASEHMVIPVAILGIAFMALLGYPALARILYG